MGLTEATESLTMKYIITTIIALLISFAIPLSGLREVRYLDPIVPVNIKKPILLPLLPVTKLQTASYESEWSLVDTSNPYVANIITAETHGNYQDVNSIGCIGVMQSCTGGLAKACPNWRSDDICQLNFFYYYMTQRYGSWANAWAFHIANGWW